MEVKTCRKCGETKPLDAFCRNKRENDGRSARCRVCKAAYRKENAEAIKDRKLKYRREHAEAIKARAVAYRKENAEAIKSRRAALRKKNAEVIKVRRRAARKKNAEAIKVQRRAYYKDNAEVIKAQRRAYYKDNVASQKIYTAEYYKKNRHMFAVYASRRRAAKLLRTPSWAELTAISEVYKACRRITEETGILHHVDHIIPLQGRLVSGLHVASNLQIIPASENLKKSNSWYPEDDELVSANSNAQVMECAEVA